MCLCKTKYDISFSGQKKGWKEILQEYAERTTVHGASYISSKNKSDIRRLFHYFMDAYIPFIFASVEIL